VQKCNVRNVRMRGHDRQSLRLSKACDQYNSQLIDWANKALNNTQKAKKMSNLSSPSQTQCSPT